MVAASSHAEECFAQLAAISAEVARDAGGDDAKVQLGLVALGSRPRKIRRTADHVAGSGLRLATAGSGWVSSARARPLRAVGTEGSAAAG